MARAKFLCTDVAIDPQTQTSTVTLVPLFDGSSVENAAFFSGTPAIGHLLLPGVGPANTPMFAKGSNYFVDITGPV